MLPSDTMDANVEAQGGWVFFLFGYNLMVFFLSMHQYDNMQS